MFFWKTLILLILLVVHGEMNLLLLLDQQDSCLVHAVEAAYHVLNSDN